jgi:hypothetical protein
MGYTSMNYASRMYEVQANSQLPGYFSSEFVPFDGVWILSSPDGKVLLQGRSHWIEDKDLMDSIQTFMLEFIKELLHMYFFRKRSFRPVRRLPKLHLTRFAAKSPSNLKGYVTMWPVST